MSLDMCIDRSMLLTSLDLTITLIYAVYVLLLQFSLKAFASVSVQNLYLDIITHYIHSVK